MRSIPLSAIASFSSTGLTSLRKQEEPAPIEKVKRPHDPEKVQHIYIMYNDRGSIGQLHVGTREFLNDEYNQQNGITEEWEEYEYDHLQRIIKGDFEYGYYIGSFASCGYKYLVCLDSDVTYVAREKQHFDLDSVYYPRGHYWLTNMEPEKFARGFLEVDEAKYRFMKADGVCGKLFVERGKTMPIINPEILYESPHTISNGDANGIRLVWTDKQIYKKFSELGVGAEDYSSFMYFHNLNYDE